MRSKSLVKFSHTELNEVCVFMRELISYSTNILAFSENCSGNEKHLGNVKGMKGKFLSIRERKIKLHSNIRRNELY